MRRLIAVLVLTISSLSPAFAQPDRVSVLLGSHHADIQIEVEEINPGVFLEWEMDGTPPLLGGLFPDLNRNPRTVAGVFRNSFGDGAAALAVAMPMFGEDAFQLDLILGGAWYPGNGDRLLVSVGDFVPYVGLQMTYERAFLLAFPGDGESFDALFAFGVTFPVGK